MQVSERDEQFELWDDWLMSRSLILDFHWSFAEVGFL
jgi:hypothetical protein